MSLNLGEVFTSFSKKYSIQNILSYVLILFLFCFLSLFVDIKSDAGICIFLLIYISVSTIYVGYYVITSHNEANNIENLFPPISQFANIIKEGIKYSFGTFLSSLIVYLIPIVMIIISVVFSLLDIFLEESTIGRIYESLIWSIPTIIIAIILMFLLSYFVFLPLQVMYLKSLNFGDFFAFYKLKAFKKEKGNQFLIFFMFLILLNIAINTINSLLVFVTNIAGVIAKIENIQFYSQILNLFVTMLLYNLWVPNLIGQIAKYNIANEPTLEDYDEFEEDDDDGDDVETFA